MNNERNELYFKRLKLYMEVTYYDIDINDELKRYTEMYKVDDLMNKVVLNKEHYLNKYIEIVEGLINEMEPEIYGDEELIEPLLRSKAVLDRLRALRSLLMDYVINYNCVDVI